MISVIIPTIHHIELVKQCVDSFKRTTFDVHSEIIVVDDGSAPAIQQELARWAEAEHIRFIAKTANEGFSKAVNAGIRISSGQQILLVNNDVVFDQPGWLTIMVHQLYTSPDIGIVGAKLLYPDRRIQHGGVYPTSKGYFDHRYRYMPEDHPPACVTEDVIAVTGALMLFRKDMLDTIGHLSEHYFIAYEDVDLCFRARKHGWRIIYCGAVSAIHLEGFTRGTTSQNKHPFYYRKEREARQKFWSIWKGERK